MSSTRSTCPPACSSSMLSSRRLPANQKWSSSIACISRNSSMCMRAAALAVDRRSDYGAARRAGKRAPPGWSPRLRGARNQRIPAPAGRRSKRHADSATPEEHEIERPLEFVAVHREIVLPDRGEAAVAVDAAPHHARQQREDALHDDVRQMTAKPERIEAQDALHLGAARLLEGEDAL